MMSDKSGIEWTEATWNPITGCTKVSQGCKHCYAEALWPRLAEQDGNVYTGRRFTDVQCHPQRLVQPLRWARPRMIFVNSMSDLFHEDVPFEFIAAVFGVMAAAHEHTFQVLTKRPERMREFFQWIGQVVHVGETAEKAKPDPTYACTKLADKAIKDVGETPDAIGSCFRLWAVAKANFFWPLSNVWLGVSVENQATADERIPHLLQTPAAVRFISAEPLLGPVLLDNGESCWLTCTGPKPPDDECCESMAVRGHHFHGIDWVIAGGESGSKARPCHPDWIRSLRDQCAAAGVPFFFKQWGAWVPWSDTNDPTLKHRLAGPSSPPGSLVTRDGSIHRKGPKPEGAVLMSRLGKKKAGAMVDGKEHRAAPAVAKA